jgi:hypothetical protein
MGLLVVHIFVPNDRRGSRSWMDAAQGGWEAVLPVLAELTPTLAEGNWAISDRPKHAFIAYPKPALAEPRLVPQESFPTALHTRGKVTHQPCLVEPGGQRLS